MTVRKIPRKKNIILAPKLCSTDNIPMHDSNIFWDKMAHRYDIQALRTYSKAYRDTIKLSKKYLDADQTVLDFGCGTGITTLELVSCVKKIYAIDTSEKMIETAKSKALDLDSTKLEFSCCDIFNPALDGWKFHLVFAFNVLHLVGDLDRVMARIKELMWPTGMLICATDCLNERKTLQGLILHLLSRTGLIPSIKFLTITEFENLLRAHDFDIVEKKILHHKPVNCFFALRKRPI